MSQSASSSQELTQELIDKVFKTVDIPVCPAIVTEVMAEAQKDMPDMRKLAKGIASDVGMSAIALKLANSALFRAGTPVHDVRKAVDRLGVRNVLCVVVSAALRSALSGAAPAFVEKFWTRVSSIALAAGLVARRQFGISPDAAYTYALFHDSAIPLMLRRFPQYEGALAECERGEKQLIDVEEALFPCTHPIVGSLLVKSWGLPPIVNQAIRFHHDKDVYDLPDQSLPGGAVSLIAVTQVAEYLYRGKGELIGLDGGEEMFTKACRHLGIGEDELLELEEALSAAAASS